MLTITNTLSGKKEIFQPLHEGTVRLYVCGITPYDHPHIGHARVYVIFDVLYRLLIFLNYKVTYCRNFTDIDDKLINKAENLYGDPTRYLSLANQYIASFNQAMALLNCCTPTIEPRVTEHLPEIIEFISELIKKGAAYERNGDVYFRINALPQYGELSKQKLDELRAGARVEVNDAKEDPLDFALWKKQETPPYWESPWGKGRPGWHIECSAMAKKYLGAQLDIHGGGMDLIFPHHENERAQTEGLTGQPFVRYWMHNAFVRLHKEKMSKSVGNFFTINQIFEKADPALLRFLILNHHYRAPLDFAFDDFIGLKKAYQRLCHAFESFTAPTPLTIDMIQTAPLAKLFIAALSDDLNIPAAFGAVFEHLSQLNNDQAQGPLIKGLLQQVLGLPLIPLKEEEVAITPEIKELLIQRERARAEKRWQEADLLRERLRHLGYEPRDTKSQ